VFTGIIQKTGAIESARKTPAGVSFTVRADDFAKTIKPGDSVAVNGVCLTAETAGDTSFVATAVGETLGRTTLGGTRAGARVNLELAATPETALGGHIVQGHVDGTGRVKSFVKSGNDRLLTIELPKEVYDYVVPKGSIAIDGVSLTVASRLPGRIITITVVPFTVEHTIADSYRPGTVVNAEADIIGKYVKEFLTQMQQGS
jgi:riboflavin synthase alpha subunit